MTARSLRCPGCGATDFDLREQQDMAHVCPAYADDLTYRALIWHQEAS